MSRKHRYKKNDVCINTNTRTHTHTLTTVFARVVCVFLFRRVEQKHIHLDDFSCHFVCGANFLFVLFNDGFFLM